MKKNIIIKLFVITSAVLLHLFFVYYLKYNINNLHFADFRLLYLGNLFNLILAIIILAGLLLNYFAKKQFFKQHSNFLLVLSVLPILPLLILFLINMLSINFPQKFIYDYPVKKIYIALLFISSIIFQLYLLINVWEVYLGGEKYYSFKSIYITAFAMVLLFLGAFMFTFFKNDFRSGDVIKKYDVVVVLGAAVWSQNKPSPIFEGRINRAFEIYKEGSAGKIQLTGGKAPGEISEAEAAYLYLVQSGVNNNDILIEKNTSTTMEQIKFIRNKFRQNSTVKKIAIISDSFHLVRVLEMCKFYKVDAVGISSNYKLKFEKAIYYRLRESFALLLFWFFAV